MLHDSDDRQARKVSHVSRTNHEVVSARMAVYAGLSNLQGATVALQCQLTPNLVGVRLEDRMHQLGLRIARSNEKDPSRTPIVGAPARGRHQAAISPALRVM